MTADPRAAQAQRIAEIAQRAQQATKGPWKAKTAAGKGRCGGIAPDYHNHEGGDCYDSDEPCPTTQEIVTTDSGYYGPGMADAEFIAHAREDIPYLLAALRAAEQERDQAIAHDRQPYPTAWAYEQACKAVETQRRRAESAEQERDALAATLAAHDQTSR